MSDKLEFQPCAGFLVVSIVLGSTMLVRARFVFAVVATVATTVLLPSLGVAQHSDRQFQDARNNALAGAGVADASDPSTVFNNPAVVGGLRAIYLVAYLNCVADEFNVDYNFRGIADLSL